jgi:hypothetical protein
MPTIPSRFPTLGGQEDYKKEEVLQNRRLAGVVPPARHGKNYLVSGRDLAILMDGLWVPSFDPRKARIEFLGNSH